MVWTVYILRCADGTFYTGITNDLARRLAAHQSGTAAKYTHGRRPVKLLYQEQVKTRGDALWREHAIKRLSRMDKRALIKTTSRTTEKSA